MNVNSDVFMTMAARLKFDDILREAFNKKNILFMEFSIRETNIVFKRISKDAQKLLIHPEI